MRGGVSGPLHAFLCEQAHWLVQQTIAAEVEEYLARHADWVDGNGRPSIVRNGHHPERQFLTPLGPIAIRIPKLRSHCARPVAFRSMLLRPYVRRSRVHARNAASRFLLALGSCNLSGAMCALMGQEAVAVAPAVVARITHRWRARACTCLNGSLAGLNYRSLWIDSLQQEDSQAEPGDEALTAVGIEETAQRRLLTTANGDSETAHSWVRRLRQLHDRGLATPPSVRIGPGVSPTVAEAVTLMYRQSARIS